MSPGIVPICMRELDSLDMTSVCIGVGPVMEIKVKIFMRSI